MKPFPLLLLIISAFLQVTSSASEGQTAPSSSNDTPSSDIVKLTSRNFESEISDGSIWLIEFYTDWCGHCKRFAPTYLSIAQTINAEYKKKPDERQIKVGKIEGSTERILSSRFGIRGYPSFYVVDGWDVYEFNGIRSKDALIKFVKKDYAKNEPLRFFNSPFGPIGQTRAAVMKVGTFILDQYENLTETKNYSPIVATMLLAGVGVVIGTFIILAFGLILMSKQKID